MVGVDEVGRGAWAGPLLVVATRIKHKPVNTLNDSKRLSSAVRQKLALLISKNYEVGEGWVSALEIDKFGLAAALTLGGQRALKGLLIEADEEVILDGKFNYLPERYTNVVCIVKADALGGEVSAAAIWGKVARDKYMTSLALAHPEFSFDRHVGYGTVIHRRALYKHGALLSVHRFSFKPIKTGILEPNVVNKL